MKKDDQYEGQGPAQGTETPTHTKSTVGKTSSRSSSIESAQGTQPCGEGPYDPGGSKYGGGKTSTDQD